MSEVYGNKPEETLELKFDWTVDDIEHFWLAIADYNGRRVATGDEPLDPSHPMMRAQYRITASLDDLISGGMREGKYVAPLVRLKSLLSDGEELDV